MIHMKLRNIFITILFVIGFTSKISYSQIDSNRYDMISSNLTFLSIPSSGTFEEVYNMSSYSTPLVVEYSGSAQTASNSLYSIASSHYNPAGNVSNVYAAGPHYGSCGLYTTKLYNLKTHSITFKGRFYNRYSSSGGEYNEYWFGFVPPNNKYYHPIVTEAGGDKPVGYLIGGWPTFWGGRNRGTDVQADNFFMTNINTSLNWAKWIEVSMKLWVSNDSLFVKSYTAEEAGGNMYSLNNPIFVGKLSNLSYSENARLVFCTDDLLDWVEVITEPYNSTCKFTFSKLPKTCEFDGSTLNLKDYLQLNGNPLLNSDFITLVEDCPITSGLKNTNLTNNQFKSNFPAGRYKFKIFTSCGSDTLSLIVQPKPKLICDISDSTLCSNNPLVTLNGKSSNYTNSQMNYEWIYFDKNDTKQIKNIASINTTLSTKSSKNQVKVTGKANTTGCIDSAVINYNVIDTTLINFNTNNDCLGRSQNFEVIDANKLKYKSAFWQFDDGTTKNQFTFSKIMPTPGKHTVLIMVIDSNDCESNQKIDFLTYSLPKPTFTITLNTISQKLKELILETTKNDSLNHTWKYTNGKPIGNQLLLYDTVNSSDNYCYRLVVEDKNKCRDSIEKCIHVTISDLEEYYIPNAFTPRKSNINNVFKPYFSHELIDYKLLILNRWGEEIYKSTDQFEYWDATFMGKPVPDGNYIYIIKGQFPSKRIIHEKGVLYVID